MTNTLYTRNICAYSLFTFTFLASVAAQAQTCATAPSCSELGYTKSASQCSGKTMLYCPFDKTKVFCVDEITCASLGFTDTISECPGEYTLCPSDSSKGKCIFEASPGDLKYSLRTSDHNGWLLCNGRGYSKIKYPDLYPAISGSFGDRLPNYSGYFLKGAATTSASTFKTAQQAGLPNITGRFPQGIRNYTPSFYGAFYKYSSYTSYWAPSTATDGLWLGFDASKSNSIYGRSSTVTPQNYSANVFIYAGRVIEADTTDCKIGAYLYTDGTCKTAYDSSKTILGMVTQYSTTSLMYTFGGNTTASSFDAAETACKNKGGNGVASGYYINKILSFGNNIASNSVVVPINKSRKYWVFGDYVYSCSDTSCYENGSVGSNGYYYCNQWYYP